MTTAAQLDLIIRAQDQASRTLRGVERNLAGLNSVTSAFGLGAVASYTAATAALGGFVAMGVGELMEAQKVQAQTNAVLKSTGQVAGVTAGHVDELSSRLSRLAAVDDEVIAGGANVLLTFTNIRNSGVDKTFDRAMAAALDLSRAFGQDLQSSVVMVGKALQDPIAGVTALRRVGVQLSEAQEEQIKQFVALNDVASAQKVILGELERQVGGSAEAYGDTFAGQVALAKLRLEEFSAVIVGRTIVGLGILADRIGDIAEGLDVFGLLERGSRDSMSAVEAETQVWEWFNKALGTTATKAHSVQTELTYINGQLATFGPFPPVFGPTIEEAERLTKAADEARRAIFDALNQPSAERSQRELALSQAQFNAARLEQQGAGDGLLSPERQSWYNWLVNTFIPAQEDWLRIDELRIDRDEKGALWTKMLTGEYRDMNAVINGQLGPNVKDLTDGIYDTEDALQGIKRVAPVSVSMSSAGFVASKNVIQDVLDKYGELRKQGERPNPPKLDVDPKKINDASVKVQQLLDKHGELRKAGDRDPPKLPVDPKKINDASVRTNKLLEQYGELRKAGDRDPAKLPVQDNMMIAATNSTQKLLDKYDELRKQGQGERPKPTLPVDVNQMVAGKNAIQTVLDKYDETRKLGGGTVPINYANAVNAAAWLQKVKDLWEAITNFWGRGAAFVPPINLSSVPLPPGATRPDNRGAGFGGGGVVINIYGADLATPAGRTYVVNNIWTTLQQRMRTG